MAKRVMKYKGYCIERADYLENGKLVKNYNIYGSSCLLAVEQSQRACKVWINSRLQKYAAGTL